MKTTSAYEFGDRMAAAGAYVDNAADFFDCHPRMAILPGSERLDARINMWRCCVPGYDCSAPMIAVSTASDDEISARVDLGEFDWDILEEHTSWLWFSDRDGFRFAYSVARLILSGKIFSGIKSREVIWANIDDGRRISTLALNMSAHHVYAEVA